MRILIRVRSTLTPALRGAMDRGLRILGRGLTSAPRFTAHDRVFEAGHSPDSWRVR
ncbi:MAG: hypothetical protein Q7W30_04060 [Coriobacteriia bacterium]|nr:hypothetical protein [Coriobacteriia bacterium]